MEFLHKASNLEIRYDATHGILHCTWLGFQSEHDLKASGLIIYDCFVRMKCNKVLNDNTDVLGPWNHSTEWTTTQWFPSMLEAGLKHFAWVLPRDLFAQLSIKRVQPEESVVRYFNSRAEGVAWLMSFVKG